MNTNQEDILVDEIVEDFIDDLEVDELEEIFTTNVEELYKESGSWTVRHRIEYEEHINQIRIKNDNQLIDKILDEAKR